MSCFDKINWSYLDYRESEVVDKDKDEEFYYGKSSTYVPKDLFKDDYTFVCMLEEFDSEVKPLDKDLYERVRTLLEKGNEQRVKDLFGEWDVDERLIKLEDLLTEQYKLVEDMSDRDSRSSWVGFYNIYLGSYSKEEIKQGRKRLQQRGVNYD